MRTDSTNFLSIKFTVSQNGVIFSMLSILKRLSFSLLAEALTCRFYHRLLEKIPVSIQFSLFWGGLRPKSCKHRNEIINVVDKIRRLKSWI